MNALSSIFTSKSFAVVGASKDPAKVGHQIFANLIQNDQLKVYPINPSASRILGHTVYPSLVEIPEKVETVIVAVPVAFVATVIDDCIQKKVHSVIMITAGFAESSKVGKKIQQEIVQKLSGHNIRLLGPNTLGIISSEKQINASFAGSHIPKGSLGLVSQSGAMLTAMFTEMQSAQIGCSFAISLGNKGDINENDALEYAMKDKETKTIGLYLESFSDLPRFFELCSEISKVKPLVILKGGRSRRGQTASLSHTAALATNYELLKAAETQMGFTLVNTVEEFIQSLFFLERTKVIPENVLVITNAGGPGVNTTDVIESRKLTLANWSESSIRNIQDHYPLVHVSNPIDIIGDATAERFQFVIEQAKRDPNIDAIHVIITQQAVTNIPEVVKALITIKGRKPLLVSLIGGDALARYRVLLRAANITCTDYPNQVVDILSIVQRTSQAKYIPEFFQRRTPKQNLVNFIKPKELSFRSIDDAFRLLKRYDFLVPKYSLIAKAEDIASLHFPRYAKTANLQLAHKKKLGAVYGKVEDAQQAATALKKLKQFDAPVLFQKVIPADLELLLGVSTDAQFGTYIACGLGGSFTNVLSDRAYMFLPTTKRVIRKKLQTTKAFLALQELQKEYDWDIVEGLVDHIKSLQSLVKDHPEIKELEINPLMLNQKGWWAVDVKVKSG